MLSYLMKDERIKPVRWIGSSRKDVNLPEYLLSKGPGKPFFAAAESVYDKVKDGEKVFASTKAEVGVAAWA
jgi:hypothetical protein